MDQKSVFYVYVLFDQFGVPRYVGKGRGNRWKQHESEKEKKSNYRKFRFIRETLAAIGEIPKIKVRQNLTEIEAFETERAFIAALGRFPEGSLVNRTDNRNGPSSEQTRIWHASRTPEQRAASARKAQETIAKRYTAEQRSERSRNNALSISSQELSRRMSAWQATRTPEERKLAGSLGGRASAAATTIEQKREYQALGSAAYVAKLKAEKSRLDN